MFSIQQATIERFTKEFNPPDPNDDEGKGVGWRLSSSVGVFVRKNESSPAGKERHVLVYVPVSTVIPMLPFGENVPARGYDRGRSRGSFNFPGLGVHDDALRLEITSSDELEQTVRYVRRLLGTASGGGTNPVAGERSTVEPPKGPPPYQPQDEDRRDVALRLVRERQGQPQFRAKLIQRYGGKCMITGCNVLGVVEAAHIQPYRGEEDNHEENGLLLRSDLHTLFDLGLLGIEPDALLVHVHQSLRNTDYGKLDGIGLHLASSTRRPSRAALEIRWQQFRSGPTAVE